VDAGEFSPLGGVIRVTGELLIGVRLKSRYLKVVVALALGRAEAIVAAQPDQRPITGPRRSSSGLFSRHSLYVTNKENFQAPQSNSQRH
jgi:hypothetical protein